MSYPDMDDQRPQFTAGGRIREPVPCPMCDQTFLVKTDLQAHLLSAHQFSQKTKTRKVKYKKAKYSPTEKTNVFGGSFWLAAIAVLALIILIGVTAPQYIGWILPVGLLALFLTRAGAFRK